MAASSMARRRVAVAISGGVDSSVAAYLLSKQEKYNVVGLFMQNWESADEDEPTCRLEQDGRDAQAVCRSLHIPLHYASFAPEYWTHVFEPFVEGISQGNMPNPDVGCNSVIKFGAMKEYAKKQLGIDWIATGHYARLWNRNSGIPTCIQEGLDGETIDWLSSWGTTSSASACPLLLSGADVSKDQSYFLASVEGRAFDNVLFPLGDLYKNATGDEEEMSVRSIARKAQLKTAQKRESMGICFVGKRNFGKFIHQYLPEPPKPGFFVDVDTGQVVGTHKGSLLYTIGQGAKISGASQKWFVVGRAHDGDDTTLLVCSGTHHAALYSDSLFCRQMHWIGGSVPPPLQSTGRLRVKCRTRHLQPLVSSEIVGNELDGWTIHFDKPIRAITPGQLAALYVGDVCLGGGSICKRGASYHELGVNLPTELHPAGHNDFSIEREKYARV